MLLLHNKAQTVEESPRKLRNLLLPGK